jgi:hypothetical protein
MTKHNQKPISRSKKTKATQNTRLVVIEIIILLLVIVIGILFATAQRTNNSSVATIPSTTSRVNTLAVAYDVSSGKAVKRTDPLTMSMRNFLETTADASGCPVSQPDYTTIVAATTNREQLFINYGCGAANSPAYVVYSDNNWKFLSPTNEFNPLGFPACDYLTENSISSQIAPVCVDNTESRTPHYMVR